MALSLVAKLLASSDKQAPHFTGLIKKRKHGYIPVRGMRSLRKTIAIIGNYSLRNRCNKLNLGFKKQKNKIKKKI